MGESRLVLGLMSGTSVDAIDAALVRIAPAEGGRRRQIEILATAERTYPAGLRRAIFQLFPPGRGSVAALARLDVQLGESFAAAALALLGQAGVAPAMVDLIGSHGQTVYHAPGESRLAEGSAGGWPSEKTAETVAARRRGVAVPVTVQLGSGAVIAARTGITTIYDFRSADLAWGGQGAPLVPYVDYLWLGDRRSLAVQNLGGIGNVTVIRQGRGPAGLLAFDTGPANMLIDAVAMQVSGGRQRYDVDGRLAAAGRPSTALLAELLAHPFLARRPPKSTGREEFGRPLAERLLTRGQALGLSAADLAATATALAAQSIGDAYRRFILPEGSLAAVLLSGGGARNPTLRRMLAEVLAPLPLETTDQYGLPSDSKEAIAFAVLAYETAYGRPGALPATTGASRPTVLGTVAPGRGFRLWSSEARP
jgi:anhydro-N-acetylmuramic acid kinase